MLRPFALVLLLWIAACSDLGSGPITKALKHEIREIQAKQVELSKLTTFGWDEVFLFEPYTPRSSVCATLAVHPKHCERVIRAESNDDGQMTIAFRKAGRVTHAELHVRWNGDFMPWPSGRPISRSAAIFRVVPEGFASSGEPWLKLVPE